MKHKLKGISAVVAGVALAGGIAASSAMPDAARAATPPAGPNAVDIFNHQFGPQYLVDVFKRGTAVGTPIILFQKSNEDPALDFGVFEAGTVNDFLLAGLVGKPFAKKYGCTVASFGDCTNAVNDVAVEIAYMPYGVNTGLCLGTAVTAVQGTPVSLQPCGVSAKTVWAVDTRDPDFIIHGLKVALANASSTNFTFPQVLTYPAGANPVDKPRPQLDTEALTGFFGQNPFLGTPSGPPIDRELWSAFFGEVH